MNTMIISAFSTCGKNIISRNSGHFRIYSCNAARCCSSGNEKRNLPFVIVIQNNIWKQIMRKNSQNNNGLTELY